MKTKYSFLCALALCSTLSFGQSYQLFQDGTLLNRFSPNGRFSCGNAKYANGFIFDAEENKLINLTDFSNQGYRFSDITDGGIACGSLESNPIVYRDGKVITLAKPTSIESPEGIARSMTNDGAIIVGYMGGSLSHPCIWTWDGAEYRVDTLAKARNDFFGEVPQYSTPLHISEDGKTIYGRMVSGRGFFHFLTKWDKNENGKWTQSFINVDMVLRQDKPVAIWPSNPTKENMLKYYKALEEYTTGNIYNLFSFAVSDDGRYLLTSIGIYENNETKTYPARIDLKDNSYVLFKNAEGYLGCSISNDGSIVVATPFLSSARKSFVIETPESKEIKPLYQWVREQTADKVRIDDDFTFNVPDPNNGNGWIQEIWDGTCTVNGTRRAVIGAQDPLKDYAPIWSYIVRFDAKSDVKTIEAKKDINVYPNPTTEIINFDASVTKATLVDLMGRTVLDVENPNGTLNVSNLNAGSYIVILQTPNGTETSKVIIK